jgi:hypothetical protein
VETPYRLTCHKFSTDAERMLIEWHTDWDHLVTSLMAHLGEAWDSWSITPLLVPEPVKAEGEGGAG